MNILSTNLLVEEQEEFLLTRIFFGWLQPERRARSTLRTHSNTAVNQRNLCSEGGKRASQKMSKQSAEVFFEAFETKISEQENKHHKSSMF